LPPTDAYSQHVVTAVIVAHDGAAWLPRLIEALGGQTKPVQRVVAVDTGSRDRSGSLLAAQLGQAAVFGMDRSTGYAAAVRRALQHKAASAPVSGSPGRGRGDEVEWLWLLHDDCEPAADALEQLLRGATETPRAAVLGPKLRDWTDRNVVVEAGLSIDTAGRRVTGVEPREVDQGQHDGDRDTLAVCSAGMLVRRDVWERLGGFDPGMALFAEDVDFCWRVHEAGFRVRVVTDAVVYHARAATRVRRAISVGRRARLLDRRNGLLTLLGNLPFGAMLVALIGNLALSFTRTLFYLVAKRPSAALDESAAILGVVGHPVRLMGARRRRAPGRRAAYSTLRADLPPGRSVRRFAELAATVLAKPTPDNLAGVHHASDDPTNDESLLVDSGLLQRVLTRPGVLLVLGLIVVAAVAERRVLTGGTLGGGALLPASEGASGLWSQFLQGYHTVGVGSASAGPPFVAALAALATLLLGKAWLAVDLLLLGCVPLAGLTAYLALRRVTRLVAVRVWAAASYALLPIAIGAISAGRLGSAVAFVLVPVIGGLAGRIFTQPPTLARRAAWATGLAVAVGAAFVPLLWPLTIGGLVLAGLLMRRRAAMLTNLCIVALTPLVLLLPWVAQLLRHPSRFLLEAGIQEPGLATSSLPARSLLLLSPGGPGLPPYWASAALLALGLAALLSSRRIYLVACGWCVALLGFAAALGASRTTVTPVGGQPVTAWPGIALAVAAAGLLLAAAAAADGLLTAGDRGRSAAARRLPVTVLALVACAAPAVAAGWWLVNGVSGPLGPAPGGVVPSLVSNAAGTGRQLRTLVLASSGGRISYLLLRGASPEFTYGDVSEAPGAQAALSKAVASLVAPGGSEAGSPSQQLAGFDIGFVLMRAPLDDNLVSVLDGVPGLTQVSMCSAECASTSTSAFDLWKLASAPSRVGVLERNGTVVAIPSGPVGVAGARVPAAGGTLLLAEPVGGWSAAVDGHGLTPVRSPAGAWAQAFRLPPGGGTLTISRSALWHDLLTVLEILVFLVVAGLALPGIRTVAEIEAAAEVAAHTGAPGDETDLVGTGAGSGRALGPRARSRAKGRPRAKALGLAAAAGRRPGASSRPEPAEGPVTDQAPPAGRAGTAARSRRAGIAALTGLSGRSGGQPPDGAPADGRGPGWRHAAGTGRRSAGCTAGATADGTAASATEVFTPGADGAAWPTDRPTSRFAARYPQNPAGRPPSFDQRDPLASRGGRAALSPSGNFDEPESPGARTGTSDGYPGRRAGGPSPSSSRSEIDYPVRRSGDRPSDNASRDYGPGHAGRLPGRDFPSAAGDDGDRDYARGSDYGDEPAYPRAPAGHRRRSQGDSGPAAGWADRSQASGWPEDQPRQGWPQDQGRRGQSWPGQDQDQDDQDPQAASGEVHHDWPGRRDRAGRRWPAGDSDDRRGRR
jgi:GT2 family glycosyltransferase